MLKKLYNEALIEFNFKPDGPILIKSGIARITGPDMTFVKTRRKDKEEVFIPGSSIKGVLRSYCEKILRSIKEETACMPTETERSSEFRFCGEIFKDRYGENERSRHEIAPPEIVYKNSCLVCKLFGSTYYVGRLSTTDAYQTDGSKEVLEQRDGVGIDRFTGGAANRAKFDMEVLTSGEFNTSVQIRNFELWQLGIALQSIQDMLDGFVRIGFGKSRGLGKIKGKISGLHIYYFGKNKPEKDDEIWGIGKFENGYGYDADSDIVIVDESITPVKRGLRFQYDIPVTQIDRIMNKLNESFIKKAETYKRFADFRN